jgi:hypothetical protein
MNWIDKKPTKAERDEAETYAKVVTAAGQRSVDYFLDTGECVFCAVNTNGFHETHCDLAALFGASTLK